MFSIKAAINDSSFLHGMITETLTVCWMLGFKNIAQINDLIDYPYLHFNLSCLFERKNKYGFRIQAFAVDGIFYNASQGVMGAFFYFLLGY